ncbi:hypothetical protein J6590_013428 [Homalodisca vitripennis]|nr:hypothetical protein J6590_013428 [Homalodisca vitripennis]
MPKKIRSKCRVNDHATRLVHGVTRPARRQSGLLDLPQGRLLMEATEPELMDHRSEPLLRERWWCDSGSRQKASEQLKWNNNAANKRRCGKKRPGIANVRDAAAAGRLCNVYQLAVTAAGGHLAQSAV